MKTVSVYSPKNEQVQIVKPAIEHLIATLSNATGLTDIVARPPKKRGVGQESQPAEICALFGVMGKESSVVITIKFPKETYLGLVSKALGETCSEVNETTIDPAFEWVNMVFSALRRSLSSHQIRTVRMIPTIFRGERLFSSYLAMGQTISIPFDTPVGPFEVEMSGETLD